jgi:hypothetical protein
MDRNANPFDRLRFGGLGYIQIFSEFTWVAGHSTLDRALINPKFIYFRTILSIEGLCLVVNNHPGSECESNGVAIYVTLTIQKRLWDGAWFGAHVTELHIYLAWGRHPVQISGSAGKTELLSSSEVLPSPSD